MTLYLVHSLRVDTFSSDGSYFMIYVFLVEWYVFVLFMFDVLFYDILLMPFLFCHLQVKRNQNEISKFKPVTIGVERPQITYLGVNGNKSH